VDFSSCSAIEQTGNSGAQKDVLGIQAHLKKIHTSYNEFGHLVIRGINEHTPFGNLVQFLPEAVFPKIEVQQPITTPTETFKESLKSRNQKYLVVKIVLFLYYGSLGAIMPYLPVYYHSLGITDKKIGQLGAITPAVTFFISPLWGVLADQTGKLKAILIVTFTASVMLRCSLLLSHTFTWIAAVNFLTATVSAPVRPLLDSSVLNMLEHKKDYGRQRLFGQFGFGVFSFLVGPLMARSNLGYQGSFLLHALVSLPTLAILCYFKPAKNLDTRKPTKFFEGMSMVLRNSDAVVFFTMVFAIGLSSGVIENFAYKRLRELGGGGNVMGVSRLLSSLMGVPMFYFSGNVTKKLSVMGVLMFSLGSYVVRFFIYAAVKSPWHALPAEALRGLTFAGMWASSTYYAHKIAPAGLDATLLGLLNGIYGGVGQSVGSLVGGYLSSHVGTCLAFYYYGAFDFVLLVLFGMYWCWHPTATQLHEDQQRIEK